MIIWSLVAAMIPVLYLIFHKRFKLKKFIIYLILWLLFFSFAHVILKWGFISAWSIVYIVNILILFALAAYFISGSLAVGNWISNNVLKFKEIQRGEMLINFGVGLWAILFVVRLLIATDLFFSWLIWIIFIGLWVAVYLQRKDMKKYITILSDLLWSFKKSELKQNRWKWFGVILVIFSLVYYFYGFQLSFIPYSTAWDANHAYMYFPKIWSLNNGVFWSNGPGGAMPGLWHSFIAFWFLLIKPINSRFWLKWDTIAVAMNFLSGIFVLIFGLWLIKKVIGFISDKLKAPKWTEQISFATGRFFLLLWLSSGMWAFLVFVDNKTDLGLMAMTLLAMLSGFIFMRHIAKDREEKEALTIDAKTNSKLSKESMKYIVASGFLFSLAALTKVTATTDIMIFAVLLLWLWFNVWIGLSWWFLGLWLVTLIKPANAKYLLLADTPLTKIFLILALIAAIVWVIMLIKKLKNKWYLAHIKKSLLYGVVWLGTILFMLLIAKWSLILVRQFKTDNFNVKNMAKSMLFAQAGDAKDVKNLLAQTKIDQNALPQVSLQQCKAMQVTDEELKAGLKTPPSQNEDVGRYVWFGRKKFTKPNSLFRLGYGILNLFYHQEWKCYGFEKSAVLLCEHPKAVDTFDVVALWWLLEQMSDDSAWAKLLQNALNTYTTEYKWAAVNLLPKLMRDEVVALRQFYQTNSIKYIAWTATSPEKIMVPYKYIVPLNVVYNWSLQNLSSYYTDIGFVWLFLFMITILTLIYAVIKKDNKITMLAATALFGWTIRWIIGWAIVRYGIGLVTWIIMVTAIFFKELADDLESSKDNTNNTKFILYFALGLLLLRWMIQFVLNLVRISSQWASGPFIWYKMDAGNITTYNDQLQPSTEVKFGYGQKDVFDMQFPHYNKIINYLKDRKDTDGVLIAGTYLQYFLDNQNNVKLDGMLWWFAKTISDGDSCYSYKRLQNQHLKYFVIDPNIGTVVMWEGNEALFQRFFAKINAVTGLIEEHGAISMLVKMRKDGYLTMFYTSNLWAKYAFQIPDSVLISAFGDLNADQLLLLRAKLSIARFFPHSPELTNFIANVFSNRMQNGAAIWDIADIYGKEIDEAKVLTVAKAWSTARGASPQVTSLIKELTQDERLILAQYLAIYNMMQSNQQQYQATVQNLLKQSLAGSSQLIVFELL